MEEEIDLKTDLLKVILVFFIVGCGIKGSPLPPINDQTEVLNPLMEDIK